MRKWARDLEQLDQIYIASMTVNFMRQLAWITGCSDIWLNIVFGVTVWMFLDEVSIWIVRLSKTDCTL